MDNRSVYLSLAVSCNVVEHVPTKRWQLDYYIDTVALSLSNTDTCLVCVTVDCLSRVCSWRHFISQLVVSDQAQDGYTIADIIDCIKWELSHLIRVPGSRLQIALDLRTLKVNAHPPQMSLACVKFVNVKSPSLTPLCVCLPVLLYSRSAFCKWAALQVNNQSACKRGGGLPDAQPGQSTRTAQGSSATSGSRCDQPKFCIKNC